MIPDGPEQEKALEMAATIARRSLEGQAFLLESLALEGMVSGREAGIDFAVADDRAMSNEYVLSIARGLRAISSSIKTVA